MSGPVRKVVRRVDPALVWRVARNTLGRMACEYGDPLLDAHRHEECVRDDESYAAHLLLLLIAPAINGDEDGLLDRMTDLLEALKE